MIPDEITPIDDRLLDELLAADEAMARSAAPRASGDESWLGDCLRLLQTVWPSEEATAAPRAGPAAGVRPLRGGAGGRPGRFRGRLPRARSGPRPQRRA